MGSAFAVASSDSNKALGPPAGLRLAEVTEKSTLLVLSVVLLYLLQAYATQTPKTSSSLPLLPLMLQAPLQAYPMQKALTRLLMVFLSLMLPTPLQAYAVKS